MFACDVADCVFSWQYFCGSLGVKDEESLYELF